MKLYSFEWWRGRWAARQVRGIVGLSVTLTTLTEGGRSCSLSYLYSVREGRCVRNGSEWGILIMVILIK